MGGSHEDSYSATGIGTNVDFLAFTGNSKTRAPAWGFRTYDWSHLVKFKIGGSFGGFRYGVQAYGGYPDGSGNIGPKLNTYSDFAGVLGTGVYVAGVAGTSVHHVGVYGQAGEDPDRSIPQFYPPGGVVGAANNASGVIGFSAKRGGVLGFSYEAAAVEGWSDMGRGVYGHSEHQPGVGGLSGLDTGIKGISGFSGPQIPDRVTIAGVWGTSTDRHGVIGTSSANVGVYGYSSGNVGLVGATDNPASYAGLFVGNVAILGDFRVLGAVKAAVVPFPDGSQRQLYCMESPELWFEDFGSAKLARGRAVVKLDANFAKVIKRGDYRVFVTPEGDCRGLYVRRKKSNSFEVRELTSGKSSVAFSYRIVGRRKDIKEQRRFAKIDTPLPLPTRPTREAPRKPEPTAAGLRAFVRRIEKEAREQAPKGADKGRARMRAKRARPPLAAKKLANR